MAQEYYDFKPIRQGTYFKGVIIQISRNENPVDLTGYSVKMQMKKRVGNSPVVLTYKTNPDESADEGMFEITHPDLGIVKMHGKIIDVEPGKYIYDIVFSHDSKPKVWLHGRWQILPLITEIDE